MEFHNRAQHLIDRITKISTRQFVDESCSLIADLLERVDLLDGLLKAEQEDCQLQRANKNAEWERAEHAEREVKRLTAASGQILTDAIANIDMKTKRIQRLRLVLKEADDYLDTNTLTNIAHGSILHQKFREVLAETV